MVKQKRCLSNQSENILKGRHDRRHNKGEYEVTDRKKKSTDAALRRQHIIKTLNDLKSTSEILDLGETFWLDTSAPDNVIAFKRAFNGKEITFIGNTKPTPCEISISNITSCKKALLFNGEHKIQHSSLLLAPREYVVFEGE